MDDIGYGDMPEYGYVPTAAREFISEMRESDAKVYLALCTHANAQFICYPGVRLLAKEIGMLTGTVSDALQRLKNMGAIFISNRGNGCKAEYKLTYTVQRPPNGMDLPTVQRPPNAGTESGRQTVQRPLSDRSAPACETVQRPLADRSAGAEPNSINSSEEQPIQQQQQRAAPAAAAAVAGVDSLDSGRQQVIDALVIAGIGGRVRTELTNDLLARYAAEEAEQIVRQERGKAKDTGKGTPIVIANIRTRIEAADALKRRKDKASAINPPTAAESRRAAKAEREFPESNEPLPRLFGPDDRRASPEPPAPQEPTPSPAPDTSEAELDGMSEDDAKAFFRSFDYPPHLVKAVGDGDPRKCKGARPMLLLALRDKAAQGQAVDA